MWSLKSKTDEQTNKTIKQTKKTHHYRRNVFAKGEVGRGMGEIDKQG